MHHLIWLALLVMYWLWVRRKKQKYVSAVEAHHGSFSPFVVMVDGALGPAAVLFLHCLAEKLSMGWERSYGEVLGWIKARHSFAIVRATDLCLRHHVFVGDLAQVLMMELDSLLLCQCYIKVSSWFFLFLFDSVCHDYIFCGVTCDDDDDQWFANLM